MAMTVIFQFLLELTAGRIYVAPSLIPFMLVYLSENFESYWAVDGAFWSGLCLDMLLHQPLGSSSLGLLVGMYFAGLFSRISSGEGIGYLVSMTVIAAFLSDVVFVLVASRPVGSGFSPVMFRILSRTALTALTSGVILAGASWLTGLRSRKVTG